MSNTLTFKKMNLAEMQENVRLFNGLLQENKLMDFDIKNMLSEITCLKKRNEILTQNNNLLEGNIKSILDRKSDLEFKYRALVESNRELRRAINEIKKARFKNGNIAD